MRPPSRARLLRIPLGGDMPADRASLLVRGDVRPFTLTGAWAGGGALVGSEPLHVADPADDPIALLDLQPEVDVADEPGAVGGGWFGYLGYGLGGRLEPVPPGPPRPTPLPEFALAWYDHLLRLDADGRWWFEALWTDERDAALRERRERLAGRLAAGVRERPVWVGSFRPSPPGAARAPRRRPGLPRAHRGGGDLPGEHLPAARLGLRGEPRRPVRPYDASARPAPRGVRGRAVGRALQPLPRAVPAPSRPRGPERADQGDGAAGGGCTGRPGGVGQGPG